MKVIYIISLCLLFTGCSASPASSVQSVTSSTSSFSSIEEPEADIDKLVEKDEDITWNGVSGHFSESTIKADMTLDSGITELDENAEILKECNNIYVEYLTAYRNSGSMYIQFLNDNELVCSWSGDVRKGEISDNGNYEYKGTDEEGAHSEINSIRETILKILNEHLEYKKDK